MRAPKRAASAPSAAFCRCPIVWMPISARRSAVFGPMPPSRLGGCVAKRTHASSRPMATNAAGLPWSEQVLAISRFGPTPTETVTPVRAATSATTRRSTASGRGTPVRSA